jgi:hypothetical protein
MRNRYTDTRLSRGQKKLEKCKPHILLRLCYHMVSNTWLHRYLITLQNYRCNLISFFIVFIFLYIFLKQVKMTLNIFMVTVGLYINGLFKIFDYSIQSLAIECIGKEKPIVWFSSLALVQFLKIDQITWASHESFLGCENPFNGFWTTE